MPKTLLFDTLKRKCNIDRLLRIENRRQESAKGEAEKRKRKRLYSPSAIAAASSSAGPDTAKKAASKPPLNKIDPIMMIPIGKRKTFKFTRPNGTMVQFNVESLVDYLLASGDFTDPETRIPFSDDNLADIDRLVSALPFRSSFLTLCRRLTKGWPKHPCWLLAMIPTSIQMQSSVEMRFWDWSAALGR